MHYYKRHIGDYAKKAGHLTPLEHGIYNLIIDSYYDREQGPTLLEAMRIARARTEDEKSAVLAVLDEFFTLEDDRYRQNRIEEELEAYHGKAEKNREIAVAREEARRDRRTQERGTNDRRTVARSEHESCTTGSPEQHDLSTSGQPNHKPLTTNQDTTPIPPRGAEPASRKKAAIALKTYLENCRSSNDKPIPEDDPVFAYADKVGIPSEFLRLHWLEFKDRYTLPDAKRYKSWPTVFLKSVMGNWFKLWFVNNDGQYSMTTVGQQAQRNHAGNA